MHLITVILADIPKQVGANFEVSLKHVKRHSTIVLTHHTHEGHTAHDA